MYLDIYFHVVVTLFIQLKFINYCSSYMFNISVVLIVLPQNVKDNQLFMPRDKMKKMIGYG